MPDIFEDIKKAMADVEAKSKLADDANKAKQEADKALGAATSILEDLQAKVHELLGNITGRVRKFGG